MSTTCTTVAGPFGAGFAATVSYALMPVQVVTANTVGLACGVALGTITGPI